MSENCDDALHELYGYLDGELTDEKRRDIEEHLDQCPPCIEKFEFHHELQSVVRQKCRDRVPEDLRRRVADAIASESAPEPRE